MNSYLVSVNGSPQAITQEDKIVIANIANNLKNLAIGQSITVTCLPFLEVNKKEISEIQKKKNETKKTK